MNISPYWGRLLGAGLLGALTEASGLALMATATWLLCTAAGQPPLTALSISIVLVRAMAIGRGVFRYAERLAGHDAVLRIVTEVRARIFAALTHRPASRRGDALSRMVSDVDSVQDLVIRVGLPIFSSGLICLLAVGAAALIDPLVALVLALGLAIGGVALPWLGARLTVHSGQLLAPLRSAYATDVLDLTYGAADLAAYGATSRYERAGAAKAAELSEVERRLARRAFAVDTVSAVLTASTAAAVLLVAQQRQVPGVWCAALAVATLAAGELTQNLLAAARKGAEISGGLARVLPLLREPVPAPEPLADQEIDHVPDLELRDVSVTGRLAGVTLRIPAGRKIAVVGASGAGKSTLLSVLAGEVRPDSGEALRDGAAITPAPRVVTGLFAEAHVFHASVRDNLLLGRPGADEAALARAVDVAGLGGWLSGYSMDVVVGEDGAELSGGQRQRVALARAVLADPPVLLLDEPTEGLDPAQADAVIDAILGMRADRTLVMVTHRLVGLDRFDAVVTMDAGRVIVGSGQPLGYSQESST